MVTDIAVPFAYHGQALEFDGSFAWELSEAEPDAYRMLMIHRYVANLFSPSWGQLSWSEEDHANAEANTKLK